MLVPHRETALSFWRVETATITAYHNLIEEVINTMLSTNHWIQGKLPQQKKDLNLNMTYDYIATLSPLKSWETIFIFHPDF